MRKISDIFHVYTGSKLDFGKQIEDPNGINFVSRNSNNNGVVGKVTLEDGMITYKKGDITVPLGGSYLLSAFVQADDFVTAQNVAVLRPKKEMSETEKWFYCYVLRANRFKFTAFGREVNKYLRDIEIPSTIPVWLNDHKIQIPITKNKELNSELRLDVQQWRTYVYNDIFEIRKGFYNKKPIKNEVGSTPFLGATEKNNGVTEYYSISDIKDASKTGNGKNAPLNEKLFPPNAVCVTNNGSVGFAYYQSEEFTCSHDVNPLYIKNGEFNKYSGLFVATIIMKERYRWQYGRKWRPIRMKNSTIKLPAKSDGSPDWGFMEKYIMMLPNGDLL